MAARPRFATTAEAMRAHAALRRAIPIAGGAVRLGHHLGLGPTAVLAWTFCPAQHVDAVAAASGVSRHALRPDLSASADDQALPPEQAVAAHLAAGAHFALTGRCLSAEVAR